MLHRLLQFEEHLARFEARLLVFFVLFMLALATYNVFYRNILVPIQVDLLTDDETAASVRKSAPPAEEDAEKGAESADDSEAAGFGGGFGEAADDTAGFGGGFGEDDDRSADDEVDDAAGFGGGFDGEPAESGDEESVSATDQAEDGGADGFAGGFGGGFGDGDEGSTDEGGEPEDDGAGGFGGGFGGDSPETGSGGAAENPGEGPTLDRADVPSDRDSEIPFIAAVIDKIKLEWIDVVLRQLVLVVGFLGAMLATRRRKHITIDALSKVIPEGALHWMHVVTNLVSLVVCTLLAIAGADLVAISIEYPKEIVSWAMEWHFQMVFPVGFGLLVVHFAIRLVESIYYALGKAEPRELVRAEGGEV